MALQKLSTLILIALAWFNVCSANTPPLLAKMKQAKDESAVNSMAVATPKNTGPDILTFTIITPHNQSITLKNFKDYVGISTSEPCSDLKLYESDDEQHESEPGDYGTKSDDIYYSYGKGISCIRQDIDYNGKTYSTGNIIVQWDAANQIYVNAIPNHVTIDFNS